MNKYTRYTISIEFKLISKLNMLHIHIKLFILLKLYLKHILLESYFSKSSSFNFLWPGIFLILKKLWLLNTWFNLKKLGIVVIILTFVYFIIKVLQQSSQFITFSNLQPKPNDSPAQVERKEPSHFQKERREAGR